MAVGCGSKPGYLGRPTWEVVRCMLDSPGFDHGQIWKHGFGSSLYNTVHRTASSSGMASLKTSSVFRFHVLYGHFCSSPVLRVAGVQPFGQDRLTRIVGRIEVPHRVEQRPPPNMGPQTILSTKEVQCLLERRETRKVGQREEKRTREAGTKMQCSTW